MIGSEAWSRRTLETHYSHATGVMASALLRLPQYFAHRSDSAQATDVPLVEFIDPVFTRMPGAVTAGDFRSLLLCPLSVERYYFPLFGDDTILNYFDLI